MNENKIVEATDFTEIVASIGLDGEYAVRVLLDSGHVVVSEWVYREEAERLELAINQVMIKYRTKRNAWEKEVASVVDQEDHDSMVESTVDRQILAIERILRDKG